jgi:pimeloyl-ACP methyl ester carboxylesterase
MLTLQPSHPARAEASSALGLHVAPCTQGRSKAPAACGTFGVFEDRAARSGRIISLRLVVLKAKHPMHRAIAWVAGGPGQSAVAFAPLIADGVLGKGVGALRDSYDVLLVDSRGMGGSHPFNCDLVPRAHPSYYFGQLWPDALLSACRARIAATSDPKFYNTSNAVEDLDDVRSAFGYPKLVLDGASYGTFFSFIYMRRHPERMESAILNGVAPPHFQPLPGSPIGVQTALDDLIANCRRDAVCHARFPAFAQHFSALVKRFDRGPIPVMLKDPATKRLEIVALSKEVFVDRFRQTLYDPGNAASIPYVVERAYHSDYVPLAQVVNVVSLGLGHALDWGAFLSYTCADEVPFISEEELKAAAGRSFAGDLRIRAQRHACAIWNVRPMPPSFNDPVRSDVPVLMITGSDDPSTPPRNAAQALPYLRNAQMALVRGAGHTTETPCTDRLITQFVRARSAKGLDVSRCRAGYTRPRFDTSMAGWPEM